MPQEKQPFKVYGTITSHTRKPLAGVTVRAYDRDLRSESLLGEAVTDYKGKYSIPYSEEAFARAEKQTADLAVKVYVTGGKDLLYEPAIDKICFNAAPETKVNIVLQATAGRQYRGSEYELLLREITPLAENTAISELQETDTWKDISFLTRETGVMRTHIEYLVLAHRMESESGLEAAFFYALLRKNTLLHFDGNNALSARLHIDIYSETLPLLYDVALADEKRIREDLESAVQLQIVPETVVKELDSYLRKLAGWRDKAQQYRNKEVPRKVLNMVSGFVLSGKVVEMGRVFAQHKNDYNAFFDTVTSDAFFASPDEKLQAKLTVLLAELTGLDEKGIKAVKEAGQIQQPEDLKKLAAFNRAEWKALLTKTAGKQPDDPVANMQASALARTLEIRYPSVAFAAQLKRETSQVFVHQKAISAIWEKHEDFDLATDNVDQFFIRNKIGAEEPVKEELKSVQRIFKLVPHYGKTQALLQRNIHSAQKVVAAGKSRFIKKIAPEAGITSLEAAQIYQKAATVQTAAMLLAGEWQHSLRGNDIAALSSSKMLKAKLEAVSKDFPNLQSLFGLSDLCACEHCRSVYSPAAYLVEILQFLDNRDIIDITVTPALPGRIAKDVLLKRRPDIGEIDLSCDNANTPLPYIDLVCELLEEVVAPYAGITYTGAVTKGAIQPALLTALQAAGIPVTASAVLYEPHNPAINNSYYLRDAKTVCKITPDGGNWVVMPLRQTLSTADELAAAPEYVNAKAYDILGTASFAFTLPFNLAHTEATAYFSRFGIERSQLMQDFTVAGNPAPEAIATEALGLTEQEFLIITTTNAAAQQGYWNTATAVAATEMKKVDRLLTKTGVSFKDWQVLLQLSFINPDNKLFIKNLDISCDTTKKEIANLDEDALDRIHRFLRLLKKTGWKPVTLNEVIMQEGLGKQKLDKDCIIIMSQLQQLKALTGIPLEELIGFYGTIPYHIIDGVAAKPLYHTYFLNKARNGFIEDALLPEKIDGSQSLNSIAATLAVCLQLPEQDLLSLINAHSLTQADFKNMSLLFAAARVIKKMKLKLPDYLALKALAGATAFNSPAATLAFVQQVLLAKTSPVKPAEVQYLLQHQAADVSQRIIADATIYKLLTTLQQSHQQSFNNNQSAYNNSLPANELKDLLKTGLVKLPGMDNEAIDKVMAIVDRRWVAQVDIDIFTNEKLGMLEAGAGIKTAIQNLIAAAGPDYETEQKAVIQVLLDAIAVYSYRQEKRTTAIAALTAAFKVEESLATAVFTHALLRQPLPGTARIEDILTADSLVLIPPATLPVVISETDFPQQYGAVRLLHKLFSLVTALKADGEQTTWLLTNGAALGWFTPDAIPYQGSQLPVDYQQWTDFLQFRTLTARLTPVANPADAENPVTIEEVLQLLLQPATTVTQLLGAMALITGYSRQQLDAIDAWFSFSAGGLSAYSKIGTWLTVEKAIAHLTTLGADMNQVNNWIQPSLQNTDAAAIRTALKARYDEEMWLDTLKEIMNTIRPRKRDALVAYVLATNPSLSDANDLFDYFLIDTQMGACMQSSRIVQAHGVIQLFVQRSLMGLEPGAAADVSGDTGWNQWKWMKNYRVWEANRKVFLYPENWIEPELLNDKSFLLDELQNELMQNEVNEFTTEEALIRYLEKLDDIAFLEVVANYYQEDIYTMHVFARTKGGDPAIYYYRRLEEEKYWTPWEKVELDITSNHLVAFVRNNRLTLAWPVFTEEPNPNQETTVPGISGSSSTQEMEKVQRKLKVQLAVSELANHQWKPKKISQDAITTPEDYTVEAIPRENFKFFYNQFADQIIVVNVVKEWQTTGGGEFPDKVLVDVEKLAGAFNLTGCKGYPEKADAAPFVFDFLPKFQDTNLLEQRYKELNEDSTNDLSVMNALHFYGFLELLKNTPGDFRITYPHQFTTIDLLALLYELLITKALGKISDFRGKAKLPMGTLLPYFFEDSYHSYVITPGFYKQDKDKNTGEPILVKRTFSDVLKLWNTIVALVNKYIGIVKANPAITAEAILEMMGKDEDLLALIEELKVYLQLGYGEQFRNMYHPLVCMLRKTLYKEGVPALMKRDTQLYVNPAFNFNNHYQPNGAVVPQPYPVEDIDFTSDGSYSGYNWELFYHVPLMLATRLSKEQKFEEAMVWFHYMFNPTGTLSGNAPQKYWVTKPFYLTHDSAYTAQRIDNLLYRISNPDTAERKALEFAVSQWREKPFQPHVIARTRPVAYQKALLMKYLDNLVAWGDYLFRQDTMESITQATQLYILADKLLGPKPRIVPPVVKMPYQTYNQLEAKLDDFGNALVALENILPDLSVLPHGGEELPPPPVTLSMLYFCVPQNDQMLAKWDVVADRLFKIRHCQNIDGVERSLALFAPPIDPGMLVRAAAAGMDISSVLAGLNAPVPYYRFTVLAQKATELVQEVRGLGSSLLQALEKKDAEAMALLRSELDMTVLKAVQDYKIIQIKESTEQLTLLDKTKAITKERHQYYQTIERIIPKEQLNLDKLSESHDFQKAAQITQAVGSVLGLIPDFSLGGHGAGGSPVVHATFGGTFLSHATNAAAAVLNIFSSMASYEASRASTTGGYQRRFDEWKLQERLAEKELVQIEQQIVAAKLRQDMAVKDWENQVLQIENAQKTDEFMRSKYTGKQLYEWMIGQISGVYFKAYQLAYDVAKKAEHAYQHELGNTDTYLQYGYWNSLKKGLQSADYLYHDLKRMEVGYMDKNKREYELTKHVSLAMLDPLALVRLRATGVCDFEIPEALYDMDHPGHYFRRLKTVSLTLPCIAGPYTAVSGKLSLVSNRYRKNTDKTQGAASAKEEYEEVAGNDPRFAYNIGSIQSIATSTSQNDSGLFELNFKDERYLPFEGCGAISTWRLELPGQVKQFDYNTISDVIIHVKYTAREGGSSLSGIAGSSLLEKLNEIKETQGREGLHLALSMRQVMPNEWHLLKTNGTVNVQVLKARLPYFTQALEPEIEKTTFIARPAEVTSSITMQLNGTNLVLNNNSEWKLCLNDASGLLLDTPFIIGMEQGELGKLEDLMLIVKYVF